MGLFLRCFLAPTVMERGAYTSYCCYTYYTRSGGVLGKGDQIQDGMGT